MQVHRILGMRVVEGQETYLVQWVGCHRAASTWHSKTDIISNHPTQISHFQNYEPKPKSGRFASWARNTARQTCRESNSAQEQGRKTRTRLPQQLSKESRFDSKQQNFSIPSDQFKIYIKTDRKLESHWAYGEKVASIVSKRTNSAVYNIVWSDGKEGEVSEGDLMERESMKLCEFWEKRLWMSSKKRKI